MLSRVDGLEESGGQAKIGGTPDMARTAPAEPAAKPACDTPTARPVYKAMAAEATLDPAIIAEERLGSKADFTPLGRMRKHLLGGGQARRMLVEGPPRCPQGHA